MNVQECYAEMGADFADVLARMMKEERVKKFALRFLDDPSFELLKTSLEAKNYDEAFRAAHTIKGVSQNLSFTVLYKSSHDLCEALRGGKVLEDVSLYDNVVRDYEMTVAALKKVDE